MVGERECGSAPGELYGATFLGSLQGVHGIQEQATSRVDDDYDVKLGRWRKTTVLITNNNIYKATVNISRICKSPIIEAFACESKRNVT